MAMKNELIVMMFIARCSARNTNLKSDGNRLFSYNTCIAEFSEITELYVNKTKYSRSTSKHQSLLFKYLERFSGNINYVDNIDINKQHLI